jgi:hypothetical protein
VRKKWLIPACLRKKVLQLKKAEQTGVTDLKFQCKCEKSSPLAGVDWVNSTVSAKKVPSALAKMPGDSFWAKVQI